MSESRQFPQLLTTKQAARLLNISELTVKRRCYDGSLESVLIGRARRIPAASLERFVRDRGAPTFAIGGHADE